MAEKKVFWSLNEQYYEEELIEYTYYPGFAISQKQKSIASLHQEIMKKHPNARPLEISTKSTEGIGFSLSAFNLEFFHQEIQEYRHLENVFQSSKVFENGGPYREVLDMHPKDAKRYDKLQSSGKLIAFNLYGEDWPIEPKTMFYDWIYISAIARRKDYLEELVKWNVFTDIEFNHKKSINCQARAAAICRSLYQQNKLEEYLADIELFKSMYRGEREVQTVQMSLFDL